MPSQSTSTTRRATMKGLGNAIDNEDSRSSTSLRTKVFQQHDGRDRNRPGWLRNNGFAGGGLLLVLHRSEPDGGILGRLSVTAHVWSRRHDAAAGRHRSERSAIARQPNG